MKVTRGPYGDTYAIKELTPGQFAYVIAVIGGANSSVDRDGGFKKTPIVPDARELTQPLLRAAKTHGLSDLVTKIEDALETWRETP